MENIDTATHKVIITLGSEGRAEDVGVQIVLDPALTGDDIQALGYKPASLEFLDRFILPVLENIYMQVHFPELFDPDAPEPSVN